MLDSRPREEVAPPRETRGDQARQLVRFLLVGASNTLISLVVYRVLLALRMPYIPASLLAFAAGATNGYIVNRRWTFGARDSTRARALYVGIAAVGAATLTLLVALFVQVVGLGPFAAYVLAVPPVTLSMFTASRLWAFADRH
jgi:putative flippase GtrA